MARTTRVVLTCDLHDDETEAVSTATITNGRARAELDLCQAHIDLLFDRGRSAKNRSAKGRRAGGGTKAAKGRRSGPAREGGSNAAVREWATANGHTVSARGRIPAAVLSAYREAQGDGADATS